MIPLPTFCIIQCRLHLPELNLDSERSGEAMTKRGGPPFFPVAFIYRLKRVCIFVDRAPCLITAETVIFPGCRWHFIRDMWTDEAPWRPAPPIPHMENAGLISIVPWARNRHVQWNHLQAEDLSGAVLRRHLAKLDKLRRGPPIWQRLK